MATKIAATRKKAAKGPAKKSPTKKWSGEVTKNSNALDLERDFFKQKDPKKIAASLKRSAEHSKRKKSGPFQSAMSMLNFYVNRAGRNLTKQEKQPLERAKDELRKLFHREE